MSERQVIDWPGMGLIGFCWRLASAGGRAAPGRIRHVLRSRQNQVMAGCARRVETRPLRRWWSYPDGHVRDELTPGALMSPPMEQMHTWWTQRLVMAGFARGVKSAQPEHGCLMSTPCTGDPFALPGTRERLRLNAHLHTWLGSGYRLRLGRDACTGMRDSPLLVSPLPSLCLEQLPVTRTDAHR